MYRLSDLKNKMKMKMKNKIRRKTLYVSIILISITLIVFCLLYINSLNRIRQIETYMNSLSQFYANREKELNQKEEELMRRIKDLNEKYFETRIYEILEEDDILFLAKKQWNYEVLINNKPLDISSGDILVQENEMIISLKETCNKGLLPENILNYGSISLGNKANNLKDNLIIRSEYKPDISEEMIPDGIVVKYKFTNITSGNIAILQMSELLRERLNLSSKVFEIKKN